MASTNSDSISWVVGETTGQDSNGGTASVPVAASFVVSTATAAPTAAPNGLPLFVTSDDKLYLWDASGAAWIGPYAKAT
jgi:hypothetical protein